MVANNYKIIEVGTSNNCRQGKIDFVNELSLLCPREESYFEYREDRLIAHIKAIDMMNFKNVIQVLTKKYQLPEDDNPFNQLVSEITQIKSYGIKGRKRLFVGYNNERKVRDRLEKEKKREVYYYAQGHGFSEKNNTLPNEYTDKVICGDSEEILKKLPDNCIDLVFTSPPYNFGLEYNATQDESHWEIYFEKLFKVFKECIRVLKFAGRIIVNIQPLFSDYIPSHHIISKFFMDQKLIWKGEVLWEKNNYNCKYTAWGSWKSPSNPYLKYTWEFIEIFAKGTLKKPGNKEDVDIVADEFKKWVVGRWSIAPERNMKKYAHPAMFPEELVDRILKLFSYKNDIILDPFNGVGTTTTVARRLQRKYLGIDISNEYCKKARQRIKETLF